MAAGDCAKCGTENTYVSYYPGHGYVCGTCWNALAAEDLQRIADQSAEAYLEALRHIDETQKGQ